MAGSLQLLGGATIFAFLGHTFHRAASLLSPSRTDDSPNYLFAPPSPSPKTLAQINYEYRGPEEEQVRRRDHTFPRRTWGSRNPTLQGRRMTDGTFANTYLVAQRSSRLGGNVVSSRT
jgi:hypothetical protein